MLSRSRSRGLVALIAALAAIVLVVAGCGGRTAETGQQAKKINIGYIAWDEDIAVSNLYKVLLVERKGYKPEDVKLQELEAGPTYAGLAQGSVDLFLDAWLPSTHGDYWKQYQGKLEDLGIWYNQATLNIAVPNYLTDINSIEDLKGKAGMFNGAITGIDPGAGETRIVKNTMMPAYGLTPEYQLQTSSSTAMLAATEKAVNDKKPIVVTLWHPHWAYAKYPLKDLTDPKGAMGKAEEIHAVGRSNFGKDFPDVAEMVKKFKMDDKTLSTLENAVNSAPKGGEYAAAKAWADQNPQVINSFAG
jgi:glycine betaine/proline transport system substrate-binding protein